MQETKKDILLDTGINPVCREVQKIGDFNMSDAYKNKKVLVFGLGISGLGAGDLLSKHGAEVVLYDGNGKGSLNEEDLRAKISADTKATIILGEFPVDLINDLDVAVLSPGIPTDLEVVTKMREAGVKVIGEIELAYELGKGSVLAITGTNGKTTTTSLLGEIMTMYQANTFVVGNIGNPYTCIADKTNEESIIVAEMSSFQLESIDTFEPKVSAILNITPDHQDRHHNMENYIKAKENIAKNQTSSDYCILNYEDEVLRAFANETKAKVIFFSSQTILEEGIYFQDGNLIFSENGIQKRICHIEELQLLGMHNYENYMAAIAAAYAFGVPDEVIRKACIDFKGVEHRIEFVAEKHGVTYYNDSKGTNPDAAIKGIQAMIRPTVLIGGGYDKGSEYTEWINSFDGKVRKLVLLGQTKEKIAADAEKCGFKDYVLVDTFEEAFETAVRFAKEGDAVLLSPACASWGMFPNYEVRGEMFKDLVKQL
jgi:UDP-N-acetylmuramoylalanine--D-glutamate ligase